MKINDLFEIIKARRTPRAFKTEPIPEGALEEILEAARYAPSAANSQPRELIIIRDSEVKEKIAEILVDGRKKAMQEDDEFPYAPVSRIRSRMSDAPILIVVCGDTRFCCAYPKAKDREELLHLTIGVTLQNMMLATTARGLCLSFFSVSRFMVEGLRELLDLPNYIQPYEVLQLGFPGGDWSWDKMPEKHRREIEEFTHENKLDRSKLRTEEEIEKLISSRITPDIYSGVEKSEE